MLENAPAARKPRRRWLQFSLRTLLLLVVPVACAAAWVGSEIAKGKRQVAAAAWAREQGGWDGLKGGAVYYEETTEPRWQQRWIGEWYPNRVTHVDLGQTHAVDIKPLAALEDLKVLLLDETQISDLSPLAGLSQLRLVDVTATLVSEGEIERLKQLRPDLIVWQQPDWFSIYEEFQTNDQQVTRYSPRGRELWSVELGADHEGILHSESIAASSDKVFLSDLGFLYALNRNDGGLLWSKQFTTFLIACNEEMLVAVEYSNDASTNERWVVGFSAASGDERFRVKLPVELGRWSRNTMGGLFVIPCRRADSPISSCVLDLQGQVILETEGQVLFSFPAGEDYIVRTTQSLSLQSLTQGVRWSIPVEKSRLGQAAHVEELANGDLLVYTFGAISDSGVHVMRVEPESGRVVWKAFCTWLGTWHSKYYHRAYVDIREDTLTVYSIGAYGRFVERLDLSSGRQLSRYQFDMRQLMFR